MREQATQHYLLNGGMRTYRAPRGPSGSLDPALRRCGKGAPVNHSRSKDLTGEEGRRQARRRWTRRRCACTTLSFSPTDTRTRRSLDPKRARHNSCEDSTRYHPHATEGWEAPCGVGTQPPHGSAGEKKHKTTPTNNTTHHTHPTNPIHLTHPPFTAQIHSAHAGPCGDLARRVGALMQARSVRTPPANRTRNGPTPASSWWGKKLCAVKHFSLRSTHTHTHTAHNTPKHTLASSRARVSQSIFTSTTRRESIR